VALKSEWVSKLFKTLLIAFIVLRTVDFIAVISYTPNFDVSLTYLFSRYEFMNNVYFMNHITVIIVFVIWIYRVHMDLNALFPRYTRSPGMALACVTIPLFNFYGIPSNFLRIGSHFQTESSRTLREGQWVSGLAVPQLIVIFFANPVTQYAVRVEANESLIVVVAFMNLLITVIYLILTVLISQGLSIVSANRTEIVYPSEVTIPGEQTPPMN